MNPKKEFVKAIMSVLRLEQNIYTIAAIEEIIDRIDMEDYTMFIAYIGERDSSFEKPIQSIAKSVDEFYEKKNEPTRIALEERKTAIYNLFNGAISQLKEEANIDSVLIEINKIKRVKKGVEVEYGTVYPLWEEVVNLHKPMDDIGGIKELARIALDKDQSLKDFLEYKFDTEKYNKPSIMRKIEEESFESIDKNVLGIINKAMVAQ